SDKGESATVSMMKGSWRALTSIWSWISGEDEVENKTNARELANEACNGDECEMLIQEEETTQEPDNLQQDTTLLVEEEQQLNEKNKLVEKENKKETSFPLFLQSKVWLLAMYVQVWTKM
ncbi:hypothetical protein KI387_014547, partial [Taxus chinensis]